MNNHEVKDVEQRVKRYWYSDGIAELASGGMFVLLGLYFWIQVIFGEGSLISVFLQVILALVMIAGFIGVSWLVNTLKARLTYPRTGYVEYRVNDREVRQRRWIIVAAAAIVSIDAASTSRSRMIVRAASRINLRRASVSISFRDGCDMVITALPVSPFTHYV